MLCTVQIPEPTKHLSVFADGIVDNVIRNTSESIVFFDDAYVIALYYKIHGSRIVYLCVSELLLKEFPKIKLSGVNKRLTVFAQLRSRAYDRYKRITYILFKKKPEIKYLPPMFFWHLAQLCLTGRNSLKNIRILLLKYNISMDLK